MSLESSAGACSARASGASASPRICRLRPTGCGRHSSRAGYRRSRPTRTRCTATRIRACSSGTAVTTSATPRTARAWPRSIAASRPPDCPSVRRRAHRAPLPSARLLLGMADGPERLHYILELPSDSPAFGHDVERAQWFSRNPIFAILHESCHADGCVTGCRPSACGRRLRRAGALHGRARLSWMFEDSAWKRCAKWRNCSPSAAAPLRRRAARA
jgi:hypothetical protein